MMQERNVGGLRCGEVLDSLPDFVDGTLAPERSRAVHEHLAGCDWCERFGGEYAAAIGALRRHILTHGATRLSPDAVRARVRNAITPG